MQQNDPDRLYTDPRLVDFYDADNGWADDQEYCAGLARDAASVLDLGCGTGRFCAGLVHRYPKIDCVGVDPAAAMLDIARSRPGGKYVTWLEEDARTARLGRTFDLIVLTGHAFQVFLTEEDQAAVLQTIAVHLAPGARFVFDSRNPACEEWKTWAKDVSGWRVDHPMHGPTEAWTDVARDERSGVVTYETHYVIERTGQHLSAESKIQFSPIEAIDRLIREVGMTVDAWLGNWQGEPYRPDSKEIIPVGRLVG